MVCEKLLFLKQTSRYLKIYKYLSYFVDGKGSRKNWVFWRIFSSYDNSNCFQLFHRLNRFAKSLSLLCKLLELRNFEMFQVNWYTELVWEIWSFLSKLFELRNFRTFQVILKTLSVRKNLSFPCKLSELLNFEVFQVTSDGIGMQNLSFLSKLPEQWKLELFQVIS